MTVIFKLKQHFQKNINTCEFFFHKHGREKKIKYIFVGFRWSLAA